MARLLRLSKVRRYVVPQLRTHRTTHHTMTDPSSPAPYGPNRSHVTPQRSAPRPDDTAASPPFTPTTPPPPPPLPGVAPRGSLAEALRPLDPMVPRETTHQRLQHPQDPEDPESPPQWEDFMAQYWSLPSPPPSSHPYMEDTDGQPCGMEPELDEEPYLSPIRTGCIDMDMEIPLLDDSSMKSYSHAGLECSRIMAQCHNGEIHREAVSIATPVKSRVVGTEPSSEQRSIVSQSHPLTSPTVDVSIPHPLLPLLGSSGPIFSRTSLRSLVMKKWSPSYWMQYGAHTLLLFRSKEQMMDWRRGGDGPTTQNLVKQRMDFYTEMCETEGKPSACLGHRILPVKRKSYGKTETDL